MANHLADAAHRAAPFAQQCPFDAHAKAVLSAAHSILPLIDTGKTVDIPALREAMISAFGRSDAEGAWDWKAAYEACEAAQILFLRRYGTALKTRAGSSAHMLAMVERVASLLPTHTRRSETSQALQQYSTPLGLAYVASVAASMEAHDTVLEPSAGIRRGLAACCGPTAWSAIRRIATIVTSRSIVRYVGCTRTFFARSSKA